MSIWDGFPPPDRDEDEYQDSDVLDDGQAPWRGDVHLDDWPKDLAGPEWKLWKKELDGEDSA